MGLSNEDKFNKEDYSCVTNWGKSCFSGISTNSLSSKVQLYCKCKVIPNAFIQKSYQWHECIFYDEHD